MSERACILLAQYSQAQGVNVGVHVGVMCIPADIVTVDDIVLPSHCSRNHGRSDLQMHLSKESNIFRFQHQCIISMDWTQW